MIRLNTKVTSKLITNLQVILTKRDDKVTLEVGKS